MRSLLEFVRFAESFVRRDAPVGASGSRTGRGWLWPLGSGLVERRFPSFPPLPSGQFSRPWGHARISSRLCLGWSVGESTGGVLCST